MPRTSSPVMLRPPVEVMQPTPVRALPAEHALAGGTQYSIKLDGIRAVAYVAEGHTIRLASRRGNDLGPRFPQLLPALAELPVGLVLDGEIVAYAPGAGGGPGRLDFTALLRTPAARAEAGTQVLYVVWDALAVPGRDIRRLPLRERWAMLELVLAAARPPLQVCMATTSRTEALAWYRDLQPFGIEGIVAKGLDTPFEPTLAGAWQKIRHAETSDAELLGITGTPRRPETLRVQLPGGGRAVTSPRLTLVQARQIAEVLAGRLQPGPPGEPATVWNVIEPHPLVEVLIGSGRHGTVRYVRLRPEE